MLNKLLKDELMPKKTKVIAKKPEVKALSREDIIFGEYVRGKIINQIATDHELVTQAVVDIINKKEAGNVRRKD